MKFKQEETETQLEIVKTEDGDVPILPGLATAKEEGVSQNPNLLEEVSEDSKQLIHGGKRTRFFLDAVVIIKRNPEARFDSRYKELSSLSTTIDARQRMSTRVKKETPSPKPVMAVTPSRKKKGTAAVQLPQVKTDPRAKTEPQDNPPAFPMQALSPSTSRLPSGDPTQESPFTLPPAEDSPIARDQVTVKIREESPTVGLDFRTPAHSNAQESVEEVMKKWKNPKAKVKKEAATLSSNSIQVRLAEAGIDMGLFPIDCIKAILDTMVSREFISKIWGGSSQETFARIGKAKLAEHGLSDFMYLPDNYQPIAPQVPGAPGIWIDENGDGGEWQSGIRRVFTRIQTGPALWMYQGQYEMKRARSMTKEEWARQTPTVRNTWAKELCRKGWGTRMRANIYGIREWGKLPTRAQRDDILERKLYESIGVQEVALALTRGDATMALYTMKCVGYDKAFAKQVHDRWATWVPSVRKPKGSGKRKANAEAKLTSGKDRLTKKQKLEEDVIDVDDLLSGDETYDEDEPESDVEVDEAEEVVYRPKGTRSRPNM